MSLALLPWAPMLQLPQVPLPHLVYPPLLLQDQLCRRQRRPTPALV